MVFTQVSSTKPSGEQVRLSLPLSQIPSPFMLRDAEDYDYDHFDDDDYEEFGDEHKVCVALELACCLHAPGSAHMLAFRVAV
jgi:hypothetical protein